MKLTLGKSLLVVALAISSCGDSEPKEEETSSTEETTTDNPRPAELKELHAENVYMQKELDGSFTLIFDPGTNYEWTFVQVDSLSMSPDMYGFLFYGRMAEQSVQQWRFISGNSEDLKRMFGAWDSRDMRLYHIEELFRGQELLDNMQTSSSVWDSL